LKGPTEVGTHRATDDASARSSLIEKLNERFGTDFKAADQLFFDQATETAVANEKLQAAANSPVISMRSRPNRLVRSWHQILMTSLVYAGPANGRDHLRDDKLRR
jgi:hypothetical protein